MGADLMLSCVEIKKDREPNWDKAEEHLKNMLDGQILDAFLDYYGVKDAVDILEDGECVEELRDRVRNEILYGVKEGWGKRRNDMDTIELSQTRILISGGMSYGEEEEGFGFISLFKATGMSKAAGFLS